MCVVFVIVNPICGNPIDWSLLTADDTLKLFLKDKCIGMLYYKTCIDSSTKIIQIRSHVIIASDAGISGTLPSMDMDEVRKYDFNGNLIQAIQKLESPSGKSIWRLEKNESDGWALTVSAGGVENSHAINKINGNLKTTYAIQYAVCNGEVTVGEEWQDTVFDLTSATHIIVTTKCVKIPDMKNPNYLFVNHDNFIGREERWEVDTEGRTVLQEVQPFFTAKRYSKGSDKGETLQKETIGLEGIAELFKISVERSQKDNETIAVTLKSGAKIHKSVQRFYTYENGRYILKCLQDECRDKLLSKKMLNEKKWLSSTVTIQSDHPEIQRLSAELTGSMVKCCEIIKYFNNYVYRNIKKRNVATFSNAYETFKSGFGDCGEHAVLLTALLRAAGIEANVVLGLVYMPYRNGYFYHAWVIAYAENLIFVDPALGEFPASKGYIPLVIDDDGTNIIHLAGLIGRIKISYIPKRSE